MINLLDQYMLGVKKFAKRNYFIYRILEEQSKIVIEENAIS